MDEVEAQYPPYIQYSNIEEWWKKPGKNLEIYLITRVHLDVLQCRFLLERLKVSQGFASGQKLLEVAQLMMATVLSFWLNRDRLMDHVAAFTWFVSSQRCKENKSWCFLMSNLDCMLRNPKCRCALCRTSQVRQT